MLLGPLTLLRSSALRPSCSRRPFSNFSNLPGRQRLSGGLLRRFSDNARHSPPDPVYQPSEDLKALEWPEESLTATISERCGFYPARLGETFDDGRFVITRKLGRGGFSSV